MKFIRINHNLAKSSFLNDILALSPGIRPGQPTVTQTGAALRGSNA